MFGRPRKKFSLNIKQTSLVITTILVYLLIGQMDYEEEITKQQAYCGMVKDNLWPDFEKNYFSECIYEA